MTTEFSLTSEKINKIYFKRWHQAVAAFDNIAGIGEKCIDPCVKTVTYFGFPFLTEDDEIDYAFAKLYFKNIVKVTEDFLAYSFLRFEVLGHKNFNLDVSF